MRLEDYLYIKRFSVYYWRNYEFHDASDERDKFIITLNCSVNEFPLSIILPTSNGAGAYYSNPLNLTDCVIIKSGESEFFTYKDKNTIVDLNNIQTESKDIIETVHSEGELEYKGILEIDLQERIIQAIENSELIDGYLKDMYLCR